MISLNKEDIQIDDEQIILRVLKVSDITQEYIDGLNDLEVNQYMARRGLQTKHTVEKYIRENEESHESILLGIFLKDDVQPFVGTIRTSQIDFTHYSAVLGICLFAKRAWKKGIALRAVILVKNYLFSKLGLHYLEAGMYSENINSYRLFERAGFQEKFRIADKYRCGKTFKEVIFMAAINPGFDMTLLENTSSHDQ